MAVDAHAAMERQDGVLEDGELQTFLGLHLGSSEEPVTELDRQDDLRLELGLAAINRWTQENLHLFLPRSPGFARGVPRSGASGGATFSARRSPRMPKFRQACRAIG